MSETAFDNETFVKFNYQRIRGIRSAAVHIDEIPRDTWSRMIDSLKDGEPTTPKIRCSERWRPPRGGSALR
jgi:hypothetical protein